MVYLRMQRRRQGETKTPDRYDNLMRRLGSGNQTLNCHEDLGFTQHIGELTW